jgi:hypothetical protein
LNQSKIDIKELFWNIPVMSYTNQMNGVVKKQMQFKSLDKSQVVGIEENLDRAREKGSYIEEYVITSIDNPTAKTIKFKDVRKISIGICKKDIMTYKRKKKKAFNNCFGIMLRVFIDNLYREFHVKVFNTGEIEIPGIQSDEYFKIILEQIICVLKPHFEEPIYFKTENGTSIPCFETVLINSNFSCRFYINRNALLNILKYKYHIQCNFDDNSYPGIRCKIYYDPMSSIPIEEQNVDILKKTNKISFMIFRTGSILISGKCNETIIYYIYDFINKILRSEYKQIYQSGYESNTITISDKKKNMKKKPRKKIIHIQE